MSGRRPGRPAKPGTDRVQRAINAVRADGVLEVGVVGQIGYVRTKVRTYLVFGLHDINRLRDIDSLTERMRWLRESRYTVDEIAGMYGIDAQTVLALTNADGWEAPFFDIRAKRKYRGEDQPQTRLPPGWVRAAPTGHRRQRRQQIPPFG